MDNDDHVTVNKLAAENETSRIWLDYLQRLGKQIPTSSEELLDALDNGDYLQHFARSNVKPDLHFQDIVQTTILRTLELLPRMLAAGVPLSLEGYKSSFGTKAAGPEEIGDPEAKPN